jgi:hypothetical protein
VDVVRNNMPKLKLTILLVFFLQTLSGQEAYSSYKRAADQIIGKYFDSSLSRSMTCYKFFVRPSDSGGISFASYEHFKNHKGTVKEIIFEYSFYSKAIKDKFLFAIRLNSKKELINKKELNYIPECIKRNDPCNFISRHGAIKIAIKDSIDTPNNLTAIFEISNNGDCYWHIQALKSKAKKSDQSPYGTIGFNEMRYINAKTGEIIPYEKINN